MDTKKLSLKMAEMEISDEKMAMHLGLSVDTWEQRLKGESEFRLFEVVKISQVLLLDGRELLSIFFSQ